MTDTELNRELEFSYAVGVRTGLDRSRLVAERAFRDRIAAAYDRQDAICLRWAAECDKRIAQRREANARRMERGAAVVFIAAALVFVAALIVARG